MAMFDCWQGSLGRHQNIVIWRVVPHCVLWCLWREHNARTFEGCETSVVKLKLQFYHLLFDWMSVTGLFNFSNVLDLIDICSLRADCILSPSIRLVYLVSSIKLITYQTKLCLFNVNKNNYGLLKKIVALLVNIYIGSHTLSSSPF